MNCQWIPLKKNTKFSPNEFWPIFTEKGGKSSSEDSFHSVPLFISGNCHSIYGPPIVNSKIGKKNFLGEMIRQILSISVKQKKTEPIPLAIPSKVWGGGMERSCQRLVIDSRKVRRLVNASVGDTLVGHEARVLLAVWGHTPDMRHAKTPAPTNVRLKIKEINQWPYALKWTLSQPAVAANISDHAKNACAFRTNLLLREASNKNALLLEPPQPLGYQQTPLAYGLGSYNPDQRVIPLTATPDQGWLA